MLAEESHCRTWSCAKYSKHCLMAPLLLVASRPESPNATQRARVASPEADACLRKESNSCILLRSQPLANFRSTFRTSREHSLSLSPGWKKMKRTHTRQIAARRKNAGAFQFAVCVRSDFLTGGLYRSGGAAFVYRHFAAAPRVPGFKGGSLFCWRGRYGNLRFGPVAPCPFS